MRRSLLYCRSPKRENSHLWSNIRRNAFSPRRARRTRRPDNGLKKLFFLRDLARQVEHDLDRLITRGDHDHLVAVQLAIPLDQLFGQLVGCLGVLGLERVRHRLGKVLGVDFLVAKDRLSMERNLRSVLYDPAVAKSLSHEGLKTIRRRHTCQHRVDELLEIYSAVAPPRFSVSVA